MYDMEDFLQYLVCFWIGYGVFLLLYLSLLYTGSYSSKFDSVFHALVLADVVVP